MENSTKLMYGAIIFIAGWFYFYIGLRQLIFNLAVGYPLIKKFSALGEKQFMRREAMKLNTVSTVIWGVMCAAIGCAVTVFCATWLLLPFWGGVLIGLLAFINKLGARYKPNLMAWLRSYSKFMPNDELRSACYNLNFTAINEALLKLHTDIDLEAK